MKTADTNAVAFFLNRAPATVRSWASRGLLRRVGTDPAGRALYDLHEAQALAQTLRKDKP